MFERASVDADPDSGHFLLFAPCDGFAVIVITLDTQSLLTTHFSNGISVVSNDVMFWTSSVTTASVHLVIKFSTTWYCSPFALMDARKSGAFLYGKPATGR